MDNTIRTWRELITEQIAIRAGAEIAAVVPRNPRDRQAYHVGAL